MPGIGYSFAFFCAISREQGYASPLPFLYPWDMRPTIHTDGRPFLLPFNILDVYYLTGSWEMPHQLLGFVGEFDRELSVLPGFFKILNRLGQSTFLQFLVGLT